VNEEEQERVRLDLVAQQQQGALGMSHKTKMHHYRFIKLIGKGSFGRVALAVHKLTGREVAIKIFDKSFLKDEYRRKRV
jgi:serine/threonine protein kinase